MEQLQSEKHLRDAHSVLEQFAKLGVDVLKLFGGKSIEEVQKVLLEGKRSPMTEFMDQKASDAYEEVIKKDGKFQVLFVEGAPQVKFIEKQETLRLPENIQKVLQPDDIENLKKNGHLGKVMVVDSKGVAQEVYISYDKELNNIATMSAKKIAIPQSIKGVELTKEQIQSLQNGEPTLIKGMKTADSNEFDAIVRVDALNKGLSFKSVNIPSKILGVNISAEEKESIANGIPTRINGLISKNGKPFDSLIHIDQVNGKMEFTAVDGKKNQINRENIMGVQLTDSQKADFASGLSILLTGLTKKDNPENKFNAFVSLDTETNKLKVNSINLDNAIKGVYLSDEQKNILLTGESVYVQGFKTDTGKEYNADIKLDSTKGIAFEFEKKQNITVTLEDALKCNAIIIYDLKERLELHIDGLNSGIGGNANDIDKYTEAIKEINSLQDDLKSGKIPLNGSESKVNDIVIKHLNMKPDLDKELSGVTYNSVPEKIKSNIVKNATEKLKNDIALEPKKAKGIKI